MHQFGAIGDRAHSLDVIEQAQPLQRAQRRPGDRHARPVNPPFGIKIDEFDRDSGLRKLHRSRHPAYAAADDQNCI